MPKKLDDLVKKLISQGHGKDSAWAIATSQLKKSGVLKKGTKKSSKAKRK